MKFDSLKRLARTGSIACVLFALTVLYVGMFGLPSSFRRWIACTPLRLTERPDQVIVLGGGGIPSESGLIRCYYAADLQRLYPGLSYVVSLPSDGDPETNSVGRMRDELVMRGVSAGSIRMEHRALNTHEQALRIGELLGPDARTTHVHLVTSPWHMRRAVACFQAAGFTRLSTTRASNTGAEADPGDGTLLRYGFWANLITATECLRELVALGVYRIRGWI